jgi:Holliday junction resolvase RusA-like endonuclease
MNGLEKEKDSTQGKFIRDKKPSITYILPGIPIPLQRPQHGGGNTWDPQKQKKVMTAISISSLHGNKPKFSGPLHLDITFYFPIPQRGQRSKTTWVNKHHEIKPDISNCIKYIEDVCNKLLYDDDSAIASLHSQKLYDHTPRTEFYIVELK